MSVSTNFQPTRCHISTTYQSDSSNFTAGFCTSHWRNESSTSNNAQASRWKISPWDHTQMRTCDRHVKKSTNVEEFDDIAVSINNLRSNTPQTIYPRFINYWFSGMQEVNFVHCTVGDPVPPANWLSWSWAANLECWILWSSVTNICRHCHLLTSSLVLWISIASINSHNTDMGINLYSRVSTRYISVLNMTDRLLTIVNYHRQS